VGACSGGSDTITASNDDGGVGGTGATDDDGGIGGTGISSGPIEDFGSLWVNGVKFETDASTVIIEGGRPVAVPDVAALRRYFRRGMIVQVHGTVNPDGKTGVADRVVYNDTVQGKIAAIDSAAGRMTVLDRVVFVDAATVMGDVPDSQTTLASFAVGNVVEVSGTSTADGAILASWIGLLDTDAPGRVFDVETSGTVARHDAVAQTFFLDGLQVQYDGVSENRRPADLSDGQAVEVRGRSLDQKTVAATSIVVAEDDLPLDEGETFWLDGLVTEIISPGVFSVNDEPIVLDGDALFVNGTPADLRLDLWVAVQGTVDKEGALVALKVIFRDAPDVEVSLSVNRPPILTGSGDHASAEGEDILLEIDAVEPDGDALIYSATGLPSGFVLDAATGILTGTPPCTAAGLDLITLSVTDGTFTDSISLNWTVEEGC
jgi:hypothetical protein